MSKDLNMCQFIGNLTRDVEEKYLPDGGCIANFSIACNDDYKKNGNEVKQVEFINLVAFGKPAEIIAKFCSKGSKLYVAGKMRTRKWQDKKTGENRYSTEVVVFEFQFLGSKSDSGGAPQQATPAPTAAPASDSFDDDIPF